MAFIINSTLEKIDQLRSEIMVETNAWKRSQLEAWLGDSQEFLKKCISA